MILGSSKSSRTAKMMKRKKITEVVNKTTLSHLVSKVAGVLSLNRPSR